MKKILTFLLAGLTIFTLTGCTKSSEENKKENASTNSSTSQEQTNKNDNKQEKWGVEDRIGAVNSHGTSDFYISFPEYLGTYQGGGKIGIQPDGSTVFVDGQDDTTPDDAAGSISEVFPAYFIQAKSVLRGYYRMRGENYDFKLEDKKDVTINGNNMTKFTGTLYYEYEREPINCNWVAYATQLKTNGAYVYWMVIDAADGRVATNVNIEETARKMAESYREAPEY